MARLSKEEMINYKETIFSPQIESFVPFAEHNDPSRLNMSAKQQTQPVISKNTDIPFLINKEYQKLTTINSPFLEIAEDDGFVIHKSDTLLIFYYKNLKKLITRYLPEAKKLVNTSLSKKYVINKKKFKKGDVLWDYTNLDIETKLPKIGYRAKIAFMQWFGYNADDAVIISESFAKKAQMDYTMKLYIPITKKFKYFKAEYHDDYIPKKGTKVREEIIWYNNIDVSKHFTTELINFTDKKSKFFTKYIEGIEGAEVTDVRVHFPKKVDEKYFKEQDELYIYNKGLWAELKEIYENQLKEIQEIENEFSKLGMPKEKIEEIVSNLKTQYIFLEKIPKHFNEILQEQFNLTSKEIDALVEIDLLYTANTTRGDKFTNLHAGKATSAMIIPDELMPVDENGEKIEVIFNTLGIPGRNNWGTIFEALLAKIIKDVERTAKKANEYRIHHSDETNEEYQKEIDLLKEKIEFINENFIKMYDLEYYNQVNELLNHYYEVDNQGIPLYEKFIIDIVEKGFYLYVPNFTGISYNDLYLKFAEPYARKFNLNLNKENIKIKKEFFDWLRDKWNFKMPFDYRKDIELPVQVSYNYLLKLHHTAYSKYNAVDFTTSYSKITGQPTRGRKKNGGQHVSWQSLAALLAHKEDNAVLKELYTIKSDAINEKEMFILNYIKNGKYYLKDKYDSVTKKTVNNALKVFGLKFKDDNE